MLKKENYPKAYTEVYEILKYMKKEYVEKIPKKFMKLIKMKKDNNYVYKINLDKNFQEQEMLRETKAILVYIYTNYWCDLEVKRRIIQKFKKDVEG